MRSVPGGNLLASSPVFRWVLLPRDCQSDNNYARITLRVPGRVSSELSSVTSPLSICALLRWFPLSSLLCGRKTKLTQQRQVAQTEGIREPGL